MAEISNITVSVEGVDTVCEIKDKVARNDIALNRTTLGTQCKNLLKNTAVTKTVNGVTFTVNDDSTITANGTATSRIIFLVGTAYISQTGNYTYTGTPSGGASATYSMNYRNSNVYKDVETGNGITAQFEGGKTYEAVIDIRSGVTVSNLTFYPMLRYADIVDDTYEPYQPSVQEQINNFGTQQQLLCDYSSAATSSVTIQITGLFSNYSAVICIVKYSYGRTSITLPLKYIKSIGSSKEYSPISELLFRYIDDNNLFIGGADAAISNVKIISLY